MRLRPLLRPVLRPLLRSPAEVSAAGFYPTVLFANGEQGFLYINDLSTMYQDSAGTLPAVLEGPVGLWLDSRFGAVRGQNAALNGTFDTDLTNWGRASGGWTWENGKAKLTGDGTAQTLNQSTAVPGQWYEFSFDVSSTGGAIGFQNSAGAIIASGTSGTVRGIYLADTSTWGFKRVSGSVTGTVDNVVLRPIPGNHATQPTSANRPTLKQDAKGNYYVHFNGTNQWMQTGSVDFTGTARVSTGASFTKLSDAAEAVVLELTADSSANSGAFALSAPTGAAANNIRFRSRGTLSSDASAASAAPVTAVVTGLGDIGADVSILRVGGAQVASAATDQGAGNYASAVAYIGAGGGTARFLNGDIYCAYTRGALSTDSQSLSTERYMASRAGASL